MAADEANNNTLQEEDQNFDSAMETHTINAENAPLVTSGEPVEEGQSGVEIASEQVRSLQPGDSSAGSTKEAQSAAPRDSAEEVAKTISNIKDYQQALRKNLLAFERLKLYWVDYRCDQAYYKSWNDFATLNFRKTVLMRWRMEKLRKKAN